MLLKTISEDHPITRGFVVRSLAIGLPNMRIWARKTLECADWIERKMSEGFTLQEVYDKRPIYCMPKKKGKVREAEYPPDVWSAARSVLEEELKGKRNDKN